jgi:hypothetical protein
MTGDYQRFKATYAHEGLVGHLLLSPAERALIDTCRGDVNRPASPCCSPWCRTWAISRAIFGRCRSWRSNSASTVPWKRPRKKICANVPMPASGR